MFLYRVVPFTRSFDSLGLSYQSSQRLTEGSIVKIPYGKGEDIGCIMECIGESQQDTGLKSIGESLFSGELLGIQARNTIDYIAQRYFIPIHHALLLFLPKNLREKIEKNTFLQVKEHFYNYNIDFELSLSKTQQNAYSSIFDEGVEDTFLLYGVTGSGKTSVYIELIRNCLKNHQQVLILIPEIILSSQIAERLKSLFGKDILLIHSGVSAAKKTQYWKDIASGNAQLIIGTRSALFYPYKNLEMIIMDESHDSSYNSDAAPRYEGLDIAQFIASQYSAKLVLGSGTPPATTMYRALSGELKLVQMLEVYTPEK